MNKHIWLLGILFLLSLPTWASEGEDVYPKKDYSKEGNPLASRDAEIGGMVVVFAGQVQNNLNYYVDTNTFSAEVFYSMFDTLLSSHPVTFEKMPGLVCKWSVSPDKLSYRMWLDPKAKWSDGKPITVDDVIFTYDMIMDKKNLTAPFKVSYQRIERPVKISDTEFTMKAKEVHWSILNDIGSLAVLPKHDLEGKDFNKIHYDFKVVSGMYQIKQVKEGIFVDMGRRNDYWKKDDTFQKGTNNFETIRYKFFEERGNAYEAFLKGEIDIFAVYTSKRWMQDAVGDRFDKNWIVKQRVYNYDPVGFQGFAMNTRRGIFSDKKVRKALAHLLNRERMNDQLMFKQYDMTHSYYPDLYSPEKPCKNEKVDFNPDKAKALLAEGGWKLNAAGELEKDGKKLSFKFLTRDTSSHKFLDIYIDDLKNAGITLTIEQKDWVGWKKDMESFNYDMTWAAWGAGVFKDPEGMWGSEFANQNNSSNITGFTNEKIDALIHKQKEIFDMEERHDIVRDIDKIITDEVPYILLWHNNYTRIMYWNKFGMPKTVLGKYSDESAAVTYWWCDQDSIDDLEDAKGSGKPLPKYKAVIQFDEEFSGK